MKIETHSELIFTIFFRRDAAVKHLKIYLKKCMEILTKYSTTKCQK